MAASRPSTALRFDLFASHAHADERQGHVSAFLERLKAQHDAEFPEAPLTYFLDREDIRTGDDWKRRLFEGIQQSRLFLAFLSPGYFASEVCRREWNAWLDHEIALHILSEGAFPIYFVEIPELTAGMGEQEIAHALAALRNQPPAEVQRHMAAVSRRQYAEVRPFFPEGAQALREGSLDTLLGRLAARVHERRRALEQIDPHKSTVPGYNPRFTGRREELTLLRDALDGDHTGVITGITGLGGIGKSELAFTYAHAYAAHYPGGRWLVPCENVTDLRQALLGLDGFPLPAASSEQRQSLDTHFAHILAALRNHVREEGRTLLVLDNVTDLALLTPAQTRNVSGCQGLLHLLATTRLAPDLVSGKRAGAEWIRLDRLTEADGVELLRKHRDWIAPDDASSALTLTRLLGGYTLAMHYAALFLAERDGSTPDAPLLTHAQLIQRLESEGLTAVDAIATAPHPDDTYAADEKRLSLILETTLVSLTPAQRHLLDLTALLGPDHVVLEWLRPLAAQRHPEFLTPTAPGHDSAWDTAVRRLLTLGLLSRPEKADTTSESAEAPEILRTHRLLQDHLLRQMPDREENQRLITNRIVETEEEFRNLSALHRRRWMLPPLHALAERWDALQHPQASVLMSNVAHSWHHLAAYSTAEPLMRRALAMDEASYGPDHPEVATDLNNLAGLLDSTNRLAEAEPLLLRALRIDEASFGPEHPKVAIRLNNLAHLLQATNRLEEAEPLCRRALRIDEASFGPEHPNVARGLNNLAELLQATNRLEEAEPLCRRALRINEASFGPEHPDVARDLNNLAELLRATGRLAEAEPLFRRALRIDETSSGPEHPRVARDLNNLAGLLQDTHRLAEAEPLFRRALGIDEASFGPNHPDVARDLNNLAALLQETNRLAEAEPLYRRMVGIFLSFTASTGYRHPHLLTALRNYAGLCLAIKVTVEEIFRRLKEMGEEAGLGAEMREIIMEAFPD